MSDHNFKAQLQKRPMQETVSAGEGAIAIRQKTVRCVTSQCDVVIDYHAKMCFFLQNSINIGGNEIVLVFRQS